MESKISSRVRSFDFLTFFIDFFVDSVPLNSFMEVDPKYYIKFLMIIESGR